MWHRATGQGLSQPPPGAYSREQQGAHRVENLHCLTLPPSGHPEIRGGTTSWVSQTHHIGASTQAQAGGFSGKGQIGYHQVTPRPKAPCASRDPKSLVADTKAHHGSTYLVTKKAH